MNTSPHGYHGRSDFAALFGIPYEDPSASERLSPSKPVAVTAFPRAAAISARYATFESCAITRVTYPRAAAGATFRFPAVRYRVPHGLDARANECAYHRADPVKYFARTSCCWCRRRGRGSCVQLLPALRTKPCPFSQRRPAIGTILQLCHARVTRINGKKLIARPFTSFPRGS